MEYKGNLLKDMLERKQENDIIKNQVNAYMNNRVSRKTLKDNIHQIYDEVIYRNYEKTLKLF